MNAASIKGRGKGKAPAVGQGLGCGGQGKAYSWPGVSPVLSAAWFPLASGVSVFHAFRQCNFTIGGKAMAKAAPPARTALAFACVRIRS